MHEAAYAAIKRVRPDATGADRRHGGDRRPTPGQRRRPAAALPAQAGLRRRPPRAAARPRVRALPARCRPTATRTTRTRARPTPRRRAAGPDDAPLSATPKLEALLQALVRARADRRATCRSTTPSTATSRAPTTRTRRSTASTRPRNLAHGDVHGLAGRRHARCSPSSCCATSTRPSRAARRGTRGYYRDWQTGLYAADGPPKPALTAFKLPFWIERHETPDRARSPWRGAWSGPGDGRADGAPRAAGRRRRVARRARERADVRRQRRRTSSPTPPGAFVATTPAPPRPRAAGLPDGVAPARRRAGSPASPVTLSAP